MTRKATATDVALEAGVSKWTVTRAFKPGASIADKSLKRVMEVANRLGYRPNLLARSLTTKKTHQIAVLVDDFGNLHKLPVLEALSLALQAEGMVLTLININRHFDHVNALLDVDQRQVDAAILLGTDFRDEILRERALRGSTLPLFVIARESTIDAIPSVSCDAEASMQEIGAHLWERGFRKPGFMSGPVTLSTVLGRRRFFSAFWKERGIAEIPELPAHSYDRQAAAGALREYLTRSPAADRIDVLMCENDALAIGAIDIARTEYGLRVPADLAIVGYDDTDLAATPAFDLTTFQQPLGEMVAAIVDMLTGRLKPESITIRGKLIVRGTT